MTQPDRAHAGGRNKDATLAQFIADPDLAVGRILDSVFDNGILSFQIDAIFQVRRPAWPLQQSLDATIKTITIPVSCVEAGRWSQQTPDFQSSGYSIYARGRAAKVG